MPAANLLALLDDIASVLDDVAAFSKLAAKKTAGVLGDDLALNAQQVAGVQASRELPVIWAVARGSFVNKAVLVPAALVISAFAPMLVTPLLMVGGTYLCFEGFEKVSHRLLHRGTGDGEHAEDEAEQAEAVVARVLTEPAADPMVLERDKIKGAIRTDFILSAEIIIIALGTVAAAPLLTRIGVLTAVAVLMTVAVYGFVGMIIKLDDLGWWLQRRGGRLAELAGGILLGTAPRLMRFLTVAGTAAMFLVGGGIMVHGVPVLAHSLETLVAPLGPLVGPIATMVGNALAGVVVGAIALAAVALVTSVRRALAR
jgi:predicted DNA repair protein MutK